MFFFSDGDYLKFLDSLDHPDSDEVVSIDTYLEELEAKERDAKGIRGTFIMQGKEQNLIFAQGQVNNHKFTYPKKFYLFQKTDILVLPLLCCIIYTLFLFDLILYVLSTIFQLYRDRSSWVEPVLS